MLHMQAIGHLGKDAIVNTVNGKTVINFSIAHTEKYQDKEKTTWVECAYWTEKTAVAPYLLKGGQVYVSGTPEVKTYNKNDGSTGVSLTLRVFSLQLLGSKQQQGPAEATSTPVAATTSQSLEDLPF